MKEIEHLKLAWEKPNFLFAQYIDLLERNLLTQTKESNERQKSEYQQERNKQHIQRIFYYAKSV